MTSNTTADRATFIAALRELADLLEANPAVPAPGRYDSPRIAVLPESGLSDDDANAFVDRFAAALGIEASDPRGSGHYTATRKFGPLSYESFHVSAAAMAARDARDSYANVIRLDEGPVAA